jgi:RNA-directed DNA polymerase
MPEGTNPSEAVAATPKRAEDTTWMEASVWTPRMVEALVHGVKGGKWYSINDKVYKRENLEAAYERTKRNKGTHGVDNVSVKYFGKHLEHNLKKLQEELKSETYRPQKLRRIYIPKPGSAEKRPISIPTVRDRVVQGAVKSVIEPIFERTFADTSFGFRPNRNAKQALKRVEAQLNQGLCWAIDCDIKSYFDTIPHDKLIGKVKEQVTDSKLIKLLEQMLEQGIMESHKEWTPTQGTPQGGVVSPLLANIYLNELDHLLIQRGANPTRYADDLVVLCDSKEQATETLESITQWMKDHGLMLHPSKTKIVDMNQPKAELDFLGYTFKRTDKGRIIRFPRQKSMKRIREAIRQHTKRTTGICLTEIIRRINRVTKGWYNYFSESVSPQFDEIDKFTRRRLRAILLKRNKTPRFGTGSAHQRWPNEFFTKQGLFSLKVAHASASYSAKR